ncbi:hypothetical protein SCUP234_13195 [Seiridium cupressi]
MIYSPSTQCDCWPATLRIVNLCSRGRRHNQGQSLPQLYAGAGAQAQRARARSQVQAQAQAHARVQTHAQVPSSSRPSTAGTGSQAPQNNMSLPLLSETLTVGRNLVQHWETLNGCASSASHMGPQTLHYMAESISWVLGDYETAVDAMSRSPSSTQTLARQSVSMPTPISNSTPGSWDAERAGEWNIPRAFVGNLELDPAEALLVAQEALSHSIARLTVMFQDIEEEATLQRQQPSADYSLRERDLKDLVTRMFRLLRRVDGLSTAD